MTLRRKTSLSVAVSAVLASILACEHRTSKGIAGCDRRAACGNTGKRFARSGDAQGDVRDHSQRHPIISSQALFWGHKWSWAGASFNTSRPSRAGRTSSVTSPP